MKQIIIGVVLIGIAYLGISFLDNRLDYRGDQLNQLNRERFDGRIDDSEWVSRSNEMQEESSFLEHAAIRYFLGLLKILGVILVLLGGFLQAKKFQNTPISFLGIIILILVWFSQLRNVGLAAAAVVLYVAPLLIILFITFVIYSYKKIKSSQRSMHELGKTLGIILLLALPIRFEEGVYPVVPIFYGALGIAFILYALLKRSTVGENPILK